MGDRGIQLALDSNDTVFVGGYYQEASNSVAGISLSNAGRLDAFVSSLSAEGEANWAQGYSSDSNDLTRTLTLDPEGALIFAGEAFHTAFDIDPLGGTVFLAKTAPQGTNAPVENPSPSLDISWNNGTLEISWDLTAEGFVVEATSSLSLPFADASPFLEAIAEQPNRFKISTENDSLYFRLNKQ